MADASVPNRSGLLPVGGGQTVYWEEWGDPAGRPALYLHGGPGGGLGRSSYRHKFDLSHWRVIGFDQRGCGRSTPLAGAAAHDLRSNTTARLIEDIEAIRGQLGVERWLVNGVS